MILIISQHSTEHTTNLVCDWLNRKKASWYRLNGIEAMENVDYLLNSPKPISTKEGIAPIPIHEVNVIWYRRWLPQGYLAGSIIIKNNPLLRWQLLDYQKQELSALKNFILTQLRSHRMLSDYTRTAVNKPEVLQKAAAIGLSIPESIITASKKTLLAFHEKNGEVVVKSINEAGLFAHNNKFHVTFTGLLTKEKIETLPDTFFPSLIQEYIPKQYEIRSFYLDGRLFSMAIFSQAAKSTQVDFRNYDLKKPNRNVPYQLPATIEKMIDILMKQLGLNSGSIDLIRASDGRYVFLEINPVGQFGMVSEPCNYYLEEKVADWLIENDKPVTI